MKKKIQLSIPEPCHADWEQMTQTEKGKFCSSCQKTVFDFTRMTDRQLIDFFQRPQTGVCGRFQQQQLDRAIYKPKTSLPFARYFFQATLPAFLVSLKGTAQDSTIGKIAVCQTPVQGDTIVHVQTDTMPVQARGKVTDATGNPIGFASIMIVNAATGVQCNAAGVFEILDAFIFEKRLVVSAPGYIAKEITLEKNKDTIIVLKASPDYLSGEVVVMGLVAPGSVVCVDTTASVTQSPVPQKPEQHFTLFPNPAAAGATLTLNWKDLQKGDYVIYLQAISGQKWLLGEESTSIKNTSHSVRLPRVPPGTYIVTATHKQWGIVYSEKIGIR